MNFNFFDVFFKRSICDFRDLVFRACFTLISSLVVAFVMDFEMVRGFLNLLWYFMSTNCVKETVIVKDGEGEIKKKI